MHNNLFSSPNTYSTKSNHQSKLEFDKYLAANRYHQKQFPMKKASTSFNRGGEHIVGDDSQGFPLFLLINSILPQGFTFKNENHIFPPHVILLNLLFYLICCSSYNLIQLLYFIDLVKLGVSQNTIYGKFSTKVR